MVDRADMSRRAAAARSHLTGAEEQLRKRREALRAATNASPDELRILRGLVQLGEMEVAHQAAKLRGYGNLAQGREVFGD